LPTFCELKGCVQGYGDYNQLTSSGLDYTELFNDIKDNSKLPQEYDAVFQDSSIEVTSTGTGKVYWSARKIYGHKVQSLSLAAIPSSLYNLHRLCGL